MFLPPKLEKKPGWATLYFYNKTSLYLYFHIKNFQTNFNLLTTVFRILSFSFNVITFLSNEWSSGTVQDSGSLYREFEPRKCQRVCVLGQDC